MEMTRRSLIASAAVGTVTMAAASSVAHADSATGAADEDWLGEAPAIDDADVESEESCEKKVSIRSFTRLKERRTAPDAARCGLEEENSNLPYVWNVIPQLNGECKRKSSAAENFFRNGRSGGLRPRAGRRR